MGIMKHNLHVATEYIPPQQNMDNSLCLRAGKR